MGHNDHREEIIALQNQSQLIEDENNELKKKVTFYEEEFRKVNIIHPYIFPCTLPVPDKILFSLFSAIFLEHIRKTHPSKTFESKMERK